MGKHFSTFLIIAGLMIILIPLGGRYIAERRQQEMMASFLEGTEVEGTASEADVLTDSFERGLVESYQEELNIGDADGRVTIDDLTGGEDPEAEDGLMEAERILAKPKAIGTIRIDKIDVYDPVAEGVDLATLKFSLGHMPGTAPLGEIGNSVVAGHRSHSFGTYLNRLDEIEVGDEITVTTTAGDTFIYEVYEVLVVEPDDLSVLRSSSRHKVLTMITCTPLYTSTHRLIVHAVVRE